jgi:hypothetical protein
MFEIRPYIPEDYEAVSELYKTPASFGGQFDEDRDSEVRLGEQSSKDPNSILVAEDNGKVVGTLSILADSRFAWLMRFAVVNPDVAIPLCKYACSILKERGHSQVLVYAPLDNSLRLRYESLGFREGEQSYDVFWKTLD